MKISRNTLSAAASLGVYPVRLVQAACVLVAGYSVCFLVYMHNNHYCTWTYCGGLSQSYTAVPIGEVMFIISSCIATLESTAIAGSLVYQARTGKAALFDISTQLAASCLNLFLYSIGLVAFTSISTVRDSWPFCYGMWNVSRYDPPEKYFCILTQSAVTSGLIAWIGILVVVLLNFFENRRTTGVGSIRLGSDDSQASGADAVSIGTVRVDSLS